MIRKRLRRITHTIGLALIGLAVNIEAASPQVIDPLKLNLNTKRRLEENKRAQLRSITQSSAFHQFSFQDAHPSSQIQFRHRAVDDAAKNWKAAHYDHGSGLAVADVDGDGKLDLYFPNQLGRNELWRNIGQGKFENITDTAGVAMQDQISVAAAFGDIDNDGHPDLFVTTVRKGNRLFRNVGGGKFEDISPRSGVNYSGHSSGAVFFDFDNDSLLDLFVVNVGKYTLPEQGAGGFYLAYDNAFKGHLEPERGEPSILYKNLGGGRFKDVSADLGLTHVGWSGEATVCDVDRDGFPDLYVLNMQGDDKFYRNEGGRRFVESTAAYFPKTPWGAMGVKFFDHNLDGHFDLYLTDMHSDMTESQTKTARRNFPPPSRRVKAILFAPSSGAMRSCKAPPTTSLATPFTKPPVMVAFRRSLHVTAPRPTGLGAPASPI